MRGKRAEIAIMIMLVMCTAGLVLCTLAYHDPGQPYEVANCSIFLVTQVLLLVLAFSHLASDYDRSHLKDFLYVCLLVCAWVECAAGIVIALFAGQADVSSAVAVAGVAWNTLDSAALILFSFYASTYFSASEREIRMYRGASTLFACLFAVTAWVRVANGYTTFDDITPAVFADSYVGPLVLAWLGFIVAWFVATMVFVKDARMKLALGSYYGLPALAEIAFVLAFYVGADIRMDSIMSFAGGMGLVFVFITTYFERGRELDRRAEVIAHGEEQLEEAVAELAQSRSEARFLLASPHFLYNTLGTVAYICEEEPERAADLIDRVSRYLREGTRLSGQNMVPFREEADLLETYAAIECERFPDLNVVFDFQATDFSLPSLSVQPLVENAIKHGVRGRADGIGTVNVSSREEAGCYIVEVADDGVGFAGIPSDRKRHIGIASVRHRVEVLCGGKLSVEGTPGKGTVARVEIPKANPSAEVEGDGEA